MVFELIVVDTKEEADFINLTVAKPNDHRKTYAVFVGQTICGLHHRGVRPNRLTRWHRELTTEMELRWNAEVLIPSVRIKEAL
ncbi:hypothetical protein [Psychrobacillus sp. OK032]|uniref:hypothetical protein n=1 Tax=Psychrobacillus sp. OK032 TaxID=1884358 RepID=UPI0008B69087|nr:hypothetical protein [Psychrobacillus sp. OK032]SER88564.1 hypothetical protein SAMN05518872_102497 [Psychrobacillus sp. OK032]